MGIVKFYIIYKACRKANLLPTYIIQMPNSFTPYQRLEKLNAFQMWFCILYITDKMKSNV